MDALAKNELLALLRLQRVPNVGDILAKKLMATCGSAEAVFKEGKSKLLKINGVGSHALSQLSDHSCLTEAEEQLDFIDRHQINFLHYRHSNYPKYLKHCADGPILIFYKGNIDFGSPRFLSMVGTRKMTSYGRVFIEELIDAITPLNPTIVSGFAYGVDIMAQTQANSRGLQTIGVLAHGLDMVYPKAHKKYMPDIESNGGFITDFWSGTQPERENFLKRNRIIAGMSQATVVVESGEKGGSLVTAEIANGYNREVFALPGRFKDKYSTGCNNLIKTNKAHMITSAADLVYHLQWQLEEEKPKAIQKSLFVELNPTEDSIYKYLQSNGRQMLDEIALQCQIPVFQASSTLLSMEMKGVIRPLPGKLFESI